MSKGVRGGPNTTILPRGVMPHVPQPPTFAQRGDLTITPVRPNYIAEGAALSQHNYTMGFYRALSLEKKAEWLQEKATTARHPTGEAPNASNGTDACRSEVETKNQYDKLLRFIHAASFESNAYMRIGHFTQVRRLLEQNEAILRLMATQPGKFNFPTPAEVKAVIVSAELARQALGNAREQRHFLSASGPTISNEEARRVQRYQRDVASTTGIEMPKAEMLVGTDVRKLFEHLGHNFGVCYPDTPAANR